MFFESKNEKIIRKAINKIEDKVYNPAIKDDDITLLSDTEKTIFILYIFDSEIMNGGICQFFSNSSGEYAPYISEALDKICAIKNRILFESFVRENNIDLYDLAIFKTRDMHDYCNRICKLYDYDKFDDNYIEITELLAKYIAENYK